MKETEKIREVQVPVFVIRPTRGWAALNFRELWEYRELLHILIWRDIKVRYKQTVIGASWAVIQPFVTMVIFSLFLGRLARIPSDGIPYPIFTYAALLPWQLFATALTQASTSLVVNQGIITKVYFPRILVPVSVVLGGLVDFGIAFLVLLGMMGYYMISPTWAVLTLPLFLFLAVGLALGISFWLSALNVEFRDVHYALPFLTQIWLCATPVAYPSSLVPEGWRVLYGLNPMAGVIEGFRWALLGKSSPVDPVMLSVSAVTVILLFLGGILYFRKMEKTFADRI